MLMQILQQDYDILNEYRKSDPKYLTCYKLYAEFLALFSRFKGRGGGKKGVLW